MPDTNPRSPAGGQQADIGEEARASREWIKPEIVTLDLDTAQVTGGGIP